MHGMLTRDKIIAYANAKDFGHAVTGAVSLFLSE